MDKPIEMSDRDSHGEKRLTNFGGLFTHAEFTIAVKKIRRLIPSSRRRRHDGNDDGGRRRKEAPRLRSCTPSHCPFTDAGARCTHEFTFDNVQLLQTDNRSCFT